MRCEDARGYVVDDLVGELEAHLGQELHDHLAECDACRDEAEQTRATWNALGELPVASPDVPTAPGIASLLSHDHRERRRATLTRARRVGLLVAAALTLFLAGTAVGRWGLQPPREGHPAPGSPAGSASTTTTTPPAADSRQGAAVSRESPGPVPEERWAQTYVFLLYTTSDARGTADPGVVPGTDRGVDPGVNMVAELSRWADELRAAGRLLAAEKLGPERGSDILRRGGVLSTGPARLDPAERLGGFFLVGARDEEDARSVVASCPFLEFGLVRMRVIERTG